MTSRSVSECYDGIGLTPDYTVENTFEEYDEQKNRAVDAALSLLGQ